MKENKGLHDGHRDRLRKQFIENGIESFFDHQIVELMLFYCIPRKDTNDMAHMLLDKFGSFSGLLDAPLELLQERGVSSNTALFIKLISALCSRYYHDKYQPEDDDLSVEDFVISHFTGIHENQLSLILLDGHGKLIFCDSIKEADLIVFSMGSLYTSVLPNIICKDVEKAFNEAKAPIMYLSNLFTQPGETDGFTVGDHVKLLNRYLDKKKVDVVIASNTKISEKMAKKYETEEQKDPVLIDYDELEKLDVELIEDDLIIKDVDHTLKHNSLKLSSLIFSYLMRK